MTDYLEQALEGSADALLEEQRRLERLVRSGGWIREWAETPVDNEPEQTAVARTEGDQPNGWRSPVAQDENSPGQPGEWLTREQGMKAPQETAAEATKRLRSLEETAPLLEAAQEIEQLLPLQKQTVRSDRVLTAARQLPAEWSGTALRRRGTFSTTATGTGRERGWPSGLPVEMDGQRLSAGLPGAAGAEQNWAQQVDRAFRRDSRRYDNGFFLY